MDSKLIEFKEVSKRFGKNVVFDSICLTIPEGKIIGVLGASGEGKSTLLKLIAGFYKPDKGKIFYRGREIKKDKKVVSRLFGLAIEDGSFYEKLTVEENLLHFGRLYGVDEKLLNERIGELLDFVGLKDAKKTVAENLSIGMKKRLDFSCSLIHNPAILVLDEPTADLDPLLRKQMLSLIKHINSLGTTVIMTTQLLEEAEEFCEKVLILSDDKIVEADSPSKIIKKYGCSSLNQVFNKIFVNKGRKVNRNFLKKKKAVKKKGSVNTLKFNKKEFENLIEEASEKKKSKSILGDLE